MTLPRPPSDPSVGRVEGATRGSELTPPRRPASIFVLAGLTLAFVGGWIGLSVLGSLGLLPGPVVAIPILVVAALFGVANVIRTAGPRPADPAEARWAAEREREDAAPQPYHAPPAPTPALTDSTARGAFAKFAVITLVVWIVPLAISAMTGDIEWLFVLPRVVILLLFGASVASIIVLISRGAWKAAWSGAPPPVPRSVARVSFVAAFAIGIAVYLAVPELFVGPLGLLAFLALPFGLGILALGRRRPPQAPTGQHPHGVPR
jgi:hypothetical protein